MEPSFADLLRDAFSEASVPSFPDGDLDFENLNCDEKLEEDGALHQEATGPTAVLSSMEATDENVDKDQSDDKNDEEDFQREEGVSMDERAEEDYTSSERASEQESSASGDDEEDEEEDMGTGQKPGDLLMLVRHGHEEDRIFAEGQALSPEGAENPQVRNEEQGESESDEEVSYFERVPERGSETMTKGDRIEEEKQEREEEKQEDSSDSECEGMKVEQEEDVLARCFEQVVENPCRDGPEKASLEFPELSVRNLQDLIAEVDSEEYVEKVKEFSGEEHQEAGERFADYPSDFSSCEYVQDGGITEESDHQSNTLAGTSANSGSIAKQDACLERVVADIMWTGRAEDTKEEEDEYLFSRNLEVDADQFRSPDVASGEKDKGRLEIVEYVFDDAAITGCDDGGDTGESDSYSSSDDEVQAKRSDDELDIGMYVDDMCLQDRENNKQPKHVHGGSWARWSLSDDSNRADPADLNINWNPDVLTTDTLLSEDLLTTEHTDEAETLLSDVAPAEDVNSYSVVQKGGTETTSPSNQGSLDDSFFFNTELEASGASEPGQLGYDEYEEERNWEQEQKRIKAFYQFYDDSDGGNEREGRQIKVQFCTNPLSQVINYETDSSDRDSLSSSTDMEEDLSSADTSEELREPDDATQTTPSCDPPHTQLPENEPNLSSIPIITRKDKCLNVLRLTLKMCVVITMGLLMFWWSF